MDLPGSWGALAYVPRSPTPMPPPPGWRSGRRCCLPLRERRRPASLSLLFRGSITRPARSLSTLRSAGHPVTTQDSLPAGCPPCRAGLSPAGLHWRFDVLLILQLIFVSSRLGLAHTRKPNAARSAECRFQGGTRASASASDPADQDAPRPPIDHPEGDTHDRA